MNTEEFLEHYGVRGMRWGVRNKSRSSQGKSDDAKKADAAKAKAKKSGIKALSNTELKALNERLNLEQNYSRLSYNPSKLKRGLDTVSTALKAGNTINQALEFKNSALGKKMAASLGAKAAKAATK